MYNIRIFKSNKKFIEERGERYEYGYGYDRYEKAHTHVYRTNTHTPTHTQIHSLLYTHTNATLL